VTTSLFFDLAATLRLAEHAVAAPEHHQSLTEAGDGVDCPAALEWVADFGVYVMSGGRPGLRVDPADPLSRHVVVYAHGWEQGARDRQATDLGGDDFVEHLHLFEPVSARLDGSRGSCLIDLIRLGAACGYQGFVIDVTGNSFTMRLSRTGPH
jgi:hypothetical protein